MKKFSLAIAAACLSASAIAAQPAPSALGASHVGRLSSRYASMMQPGPKSCLPASMKQELDIEPDGTIDAAYSWGTLITPEGQTWMYTTAARFSDEGFGETITGADIVVYDATMTQHAAFSIDLSLAEGETTINSVQVAPVLTRKFFNYDDAFELMVYVHATTEDYAGHDYTLAYSLKDGKKLCSINGNLIADVNTAPDPWSENFTMVFMREEIDDDWNYTLLFDVYEKSTYGSNGARLAHTFAVDYKTYSGAGDSALPLLVTERNNAIFYALPHYEKPFFIEGEDYYVEVPTPTPDNTFIIDVYDASFSLVSSTKIPMVPRDEFMYSFPGMGQLLGFDDLSFGLFSQDDDPVFIVTHENYVTAADDFMYDFEAYDVDGNKIATIMRDATGYIGLSGIDGAEMQTCFITEEADSAPVFNMVNIPSCTIVTSLNTAVGDDNSLTNLIDRVPFGNSYRYVVSLSNAESDASGNALHPIAWYNADGSLHKMEKINLGPNIALAQPYIQQEAFAPALINTDANTEYMFLVKEYVDPKVSSRTHELLRIYNDKGSVLLEAGPDQATGAYLCSVFFNNPLTPDSKLIIAYYEENGYSLRHYSLPLNTFAGGFGTPRSPYMLATPADVMSMQNLPAAHYALACDIDFEGMAFSGNVGSFTGSLDGRGRTISNAVLTNGLFESVNASGSVRNLRIEGSMLSGSSDAGFIASTAAGEGSGIKPVFENIHIDNCVITGSDGYFGSIVGSAGLYASISGCDVNNVQIIISGEAVAGGIAGRLTTSANADACYFSGLVSADVAGGIVGETINTREPITNCHVNARIEAASVAGGILGSSGRSPVSHNYVQGTISARGEANASAGGIVGALSTSYESEVAAIVTDNIAQLDDITAEAASGYSLAHRIIGLSSGENRLVDWDKVTEDMTPDQYPYTVEDPEHGLANNYAVGLEPVAAADDAEGIEGASLTDISLGFLESHEWAMGESLKSPWVFESGKLSLYFEERDPELGIASPDGNSVAAAITFNGSEISAPGCEITLYAVSGMAVGSAFGSISVASLPSGLYVAVANGPAGQASLKIAVK